MLTDQEEQFVERVAGMLSGAGLPRMAGRIWGFLMTCEPAEQTAGDIATALHASRGSISSMVRLLEAAMLIRRTTKRGDRREYFSMPPGSVIAILESRIPSTVAWRRLAEDGLELLADRPPESRARLQEVRDVYAHMERELPAMLERFKTERAARDNGRTPSSVLVRKD
jgi:DNA-binding transcriptional regulator GbsR (MarR family)